MHPPEHATCRDPACANSRNPLDYHRRGDRLEGSQLDVLSFGFSGNKSTCLTIVEARWIPRWSLLTSSSPLSLRHLFEAKDIGQESDILTRYTQEFSLLRAGLVYFMQPIDIMLKAMQKGRWS